MYVELYLFLITQLNICTICIVILNSLGVYTPPNAWTVTHWFIQA